MHLHTGHSLQEFDEIFAAVQEPLIEYYRRADHAVTAHCNQLHATPHNMLCLTLYYIRHYLPYRFIADDFNMAEKTVDFIVGFVIEQLHKHLTPLHIKFNASELQSQHNSNSQLPSAHLLIDSTFIAIHQPENADDRKRFYHIKSFTRYALKFQIATDLHGFIVHVSDAVVGSVHDKRLYDSSSLIALVSENMKVIGDKGYQGCQHFFLPLKEPRDRELNDDEKTHNYKVDSQRALVENVFHRMKQYAILGDIYRGSRDAVENVTMIAQVCATLTNINTRSHPLRA